MKFYNYGDPMKCETSFCYFKKEFGSEYCSECGRGNFMVILLLVVVSMFIGYLVGIYI